MRILITIKDIELRETLAKEEIKQKILKILIINQNNELDLSQNQKKLVKKKLSIKLQKTSSKAKIVRRCVETNKARVMTNEFKISRHKLKNMLDLGYVYGYQKAVW